MDTTPRRDLGSLRKSEIILGFIWWFMFLLGTQLIVGVILALRGYDISNLSGPGFEKLNFWNSLCNLIAIVLIFRHFLAQQGKRALKNLGPVIGTALLGFVIYMGLNIAMNVLTELLIRTSGVDYYNANQDAVEELITGNPQAGVLVALISAPIVEECLNRGLIFGLIYKKNRILAYAVSMLVFAAIHVVGAAFSQNVLVSVISILAYLVPGFVLAWAYERTGTIWTSILIHLGINTIATIAMLLLPQLERYVG